ncbi:lipoprotein [Bordetella ansorpii]|uniref:Lipoprotein n=1 Tax=Bordetella ansorpii TaxID=288768 RepID=A0A157NZW7_9BORD|nr:tripartite tricarboxylate transporter substrate binding protein [Bordetella ansorpii]SAI26534.1 lipoprotein [Bordetella ansorpii]
MSLHRLPRHCRGLLGCITLGAAALLPLAAATAQSAFPGDRPVSIVVPYSPGGATDAVARLLSTKLTTSMKGTFIVENRPGASGTIAMSSVVRARPDGHTLFMNEITSTVVSELVPNLSFDPVKSLQPAVLVAETPFVLVINSNVPARTLAEFVEYARANPGKITYGSGGVGSGPHLAGELFKQLTGADILHVPYRGSGPALQDLLGGQIQMLITAAPTVAPFVSEGRLRALAVARGERIKALPNVPTSKEAGLAGFEISNWFGLAAPQDTPPPVLEAIAQGVNQALRDKDFLANLETAGAVPLGGSSGAARDRVASETQRWSAMLQANAGGQGAKK